MSVYNKGIPGVSHNCKRGETHHLGFLDEICLAYLRVCLVLHSGLSRSAFGREIKGFIRTQARGKEGETDPLSHTAIARQIGLVRGHRSSTGCTTWPSLFSLVPLISRSWRINSSCPSIQPSICLCDLVCCTAFFDIRQTAVLDGCWAFGRGERIVGSWDLCGRQSDGRPRRERRMQDAAVCVSHVSVILPAMRSRVIWMVSARAREHDGFLYEDEAEG